MIFSQRPDLGHYVGSSLENDYYAERTPIGLRVRMVESEEDSGYQSYGADDVFNASSAGFTKFVRQLEVGQHLAHIADI